MTTETTLYLECFVADESKDAVFNTGATASAISKSQVPKGLLEYCKPVVVRMGNNLTLGSLGRCKIKVKLGTRAAWHYCLVLDTDAFHVIIGMELVNSHPWINVVSFHPDRLVITGEDGRIEEIMLTEKTNATRSVMGLLKTECYSLIEPYRSKAFKELLAGEKDFDGKPWEVEVDLFSNDKNALEKYNCTKQNSAYKNDWARLKAARNPLFSQLLKV